MSPTILTCSHCHLLSKKSLTCFISSYLTLTKTNIQEDRNKSDNDSKRTGLIPHLALYYSVDLFSCLLSSYRDRYHYFCHNGDSASLLQMNLQKKLIYLVFRVFFIVILRRKAAIVGQYLIARSLKFVARPSHKTNQRSKSSSCFIAWQYPFF